jgi:Amt family ammonium transporter
MSWLGIEWMKKGKPTALGAVSGAVAGLVAITPAAGFVSPLSAILIGTGAGLVCYWIVNLKTSLGYDDSLDVIGIHGAGGLWGALATGLFASTAVNPGGADGLFFGNPYLFIVQLEAVIATMVYVFVSTFVLLKVVNLTVGLRVDEQTEFVGLDHALHGESGYTS